MKLLCLLVGMSASSFVGMEPLMPKKDNNIIELPLEWQISVSEDKRLMVDYDSKSQIITLLELAHGSAQQAGSVHMEDLVAIDELSNVKVLGLARLPQPREYIALLLATKKRFRIRSSACVWI